MQRDRIRPFGDWLQEYKQGALHAELSEALADAAVASMEHRKVSTVTLKIKVTAHSDGSTVYVEDDVDKKLAKAPRGGFTFFADGEGNLSRSDPNQLELGPLRVVETPEAEPVIVDTGTGEVRTID